MGRAPCSNSLHSSQKAFHSKFLGVFLFCSGRRKERTWVVTGKSSGSPEKGNVDKMSENRRQKCPKNVQKLSRGAENTIFGHFLDIFCLFGRCFCLVTLSNARSLQDLGTQGTLHLNLLFLKHSFQTPDHMNCHGHPQ